MDLELESVEWQHLQNFHQDPTLGTLSKLHHSCRSLLGVLEDMEAPDELGDGVR